MKIQGKYSVNFRRKTIKKILFALLGLYKGISRLFLKMRGLTEEDAAYRRLVSGKSWNDFCDTLKSAGAAVMGPKAPKNPLDQAEGYRYLSRLIRAGLENFIEYADPKAPVLRRMVHETVKIGADNPDNYYQNATISGEYEYRISGTRNSVHFLGFSTQRGNYGQGGGLPPSGFLDAKDVYIGPDGSFEIIVSCRKHEGNWLPMAPDSSLLIVRQTFLDRETEVPADLEIRRIGGDGTPSPVTAESIDKGLSTAGNLAVGASLLFAKWAGDFSRHTNELPQMPPEVSNKAGGDPKIAYYHSYWKLEHDEALVIEATPPKCEHWNFQLNNHWMESLDYRYFRIHINKYTAVYEPDGAVRIIVAHRDPGHPNWIRTVGHDRGTMCFRWIKASEHPRPRCRVVKQAESGELAGGNI